MSDFPFATPFMTAGAEQCRYFIGEEIGMHATVCGCKALAGLSYCAPHARIVFQPTRPFATRVRRDIDVAVAPANADHEPDLTEIYS